MNLIWKYKLKPNKTQTAAMLAHLETYRTLYNRALQAKQTAYQSKGITLSLGDLKKTYITLERKETPSLTAVPYGAAAQVLDRLDLAFKAFFRRVKQGETPGYPKFKKVHEFRSWTYNTYGSGCKLRGDDTRPKLYLFGIGEIKMFFYRPFPEGAIIKNVEIVKQPDGWFAHFLLDVPDAASEPSALPAVGIDMGVKEFVTTSEGETHSPQKLLRAAGEKLAVLQRAQSTKKRFSYRWKQLARQIAKVHHRVANQRKEWHITTANALLSQYGTVVHEKLQIANLVRKPKAKKGEKEGEFLPNGASAKAGLNKSILDAAWGNFLLRLRNQARKFGAQVVEVPAANTTQQCSTCGQMPRGKITLSQRVYRCEHCGHRQDRDWNAARNILARGLELLGMEQKSEPVEVRQPEPPKQRGRTKKPVPQLALSFE